MTTTNDDRVSKRAAGLLPEEQVAGSDDPVAQAAAILAESDARLAGRTTAVESRTSDEMTPPV